MIMYVVSKSSNFRFALCPENVVEVCNERTEARSHAQDFTYADEQNHYVYEVDIKLSASARSVKVVEMHDHS
jgi:hypothetical protein